MRRFALIPVVIALCAGVTAPVAHAAPNLKPLTACQTQSDLCITDPNRIYHAYFFNPAAGLCEYQITIFWGDKTSSQITLRDEVFIDHTYPGPGIYNYKATSPPGTGPDCPAGESRYTFEVPLNAAEAAVVKKSVKVVRGEVTVAKKFDNDDSAQQKRQLAAKGHKLDKKGKGALKEWRELGLPTKRNEPAAEIKRGTYLAVFEALKYVVLSTIKDIHGCLTQENPNQVCDERPCIAMTTAVGFRPTLTVGRPPIQAPRGALPEC